MAVDYTISEGTVSNIFKNREKYLNEFNSRSKKVKRIRKTNTNEKINELVLRFISTSNANRVPINGPLIKAFALEIAQNNNITDFKASNGWLQKLTKRYDIRFNSYSGEAADVSEQVVENWK